jgi:hypothetical protein
LLRARLEVRDDATRCDSRGLQVEAFAEGDSDATR